MKKNIGNVVLEFLQGDIAAQNDFDAVVNAANAQLRPGGGVAGAIHRGAGPDLEEECRPLAPIRPGESVITGGHNLPNKYVVHCLGPVYGADKPEDKLLADCYRKALELAEEKMISSIAFPSISTGAFGYPMEDATEVALKSVLDTIPNLKNVKRIAFILRSEEDIDLFSKTLSSLTS